MQELVRSRLYEDRSHFPAIGFRQALEEVRKVRGRKPRGPDRSDPTDGLPIRLNDERFAARPHAVEDLRELTGRLRGA